MFMVITIILILSAPLAHSYAYSSLSPPPHTPARLLVIFRPPSRNTVGFIDADSSYSYDLPELELGAAISKSLRLRRPLTTTTGEARFSFAEAVDDDRGDHRHGSSFKWLVGLEDIVGGEDLAAAAVSKCILTFGLYKVYAWGPDHGSTLHRLKGCRDLVRTEMARRGRGYEVGVTRRCDHLPKSEMERLTREYSRALGFFSFDSSSSVADPRSAEAQPDKACSIIVNDDEKRGTVIRGVWFGLTLAKGMASGGDTLAFRPRRPRSGVLATFTLQRLPYKAPTAMEPELGLLMASLAGVGEPTGRRVLDPFCGSGSLLLAARVMGAADVVGSDVDDQYAGANGPAIHHNFEVLGFTPSGLSLLCQDVQTLAAATELWGEEAFGAILTDLPYQIKERTPNISASHLLRSFLQLCDSKVLAPGGRCVFFYGYWSLGQGTPPPPPFPPHDNDDAATGAGPPRVLVLVDRDGTQSTIPLPHSLSLVISRRQHFSPHFSRALIVLEKSKN